MAGRVVIAVAALEPRSRGCATVVGPDPEAAPRLDHGYLSDPAGIDLAVLAEGTERGRELAATEPLRSLIGAEIAPSLDGSIEQVPCALLPPGRDVRDGRRVGSARGL